MAWSKVQQPWKKPLKWWYHKILCEIGYAIGGSNHFLYYRHLKKMLNTGYTLYGETWTISIAKTLSDAMQEERYAMKSIVSSVAFALESDENPFKQSLPNSEHP